MYCWLLSTSPNVTLGLGDVADAATFGSRISELISTFSHVRSDSLSPLAALASHRHLFVKHFPPKKVQMCLLSEIRGCHGDTARPTCSNDAFLVFASPWMTFRLFSPLHCLKTCWNSMDLLTPSLFFFFCPTETSSKNSWSLTEPGALAI